MVSVGEAAQSTQEVAHRNNNNDITYGYLSK